MDLRVFHFLFIYTPLIIQ